MSAIFANNATGTISTDITAFATSIVLAAGDGTRFPNPTGGNYFFATLANNVTVEVIVCTARLADTLTVLRGQDGTVAQAFPAGSRLEMRPIAGMFSPAAIGALSVSGGTLTGPITLPGAPTNVSHAATKQYVDDHINDATAAHAASAISTSQYPGATTVDGAIALTYTEKFPYSGGVFTGNLGINVTPKGDLGGVFVTAGNCFVGNGDLRIASNCYYSTQGISGWYTYSASPIASLYIATNNSHLFYVPASISSLGADQLITWRSPTAINPYGGLVIPAPAQLSAAIDTSGNGTVIPAGGFIEFSPMGAGLLTLAVSGVGSALYMYHYVQSLGVQAGYIGRISIVSVLYDDFTQPAGTYSFAAIMPDGVQSMGVSPANSLGLSIRRNLIGTFMRVYNNTDKPFTFGITVHKTLSI